MSNKGKHPLPRSECLCGICQEILLEPVTLPCNHTLCHPCFKMTVEKASLCCPFCRKRVSTWSRHNARAGTLVNMKLWKIIQHQFPEECKRRASGQDTEEGNFEDGYTSYPTPHLCKPGEIREEYEAEISKIEAERIRREEEERRASEEYIRKLLEEEDAEQRLILERTQCELEEQLKRDEELARILNDDLNESAASSDYVSPVASPVISKQITSSKSRKNVKGKAPRSGDIERFLSPKPNKNMQEEARRTDIRTMSSYMQSNTPVLLDSEDDTMPTLSPQTLFPINDRTIDESDSILRLPSLLKYTPPEAYNDGLQSPGPSRCNEASNKDGQANTASVDFSSSRSSSFLDDPRKKSSSEFSNVVTSTPEQRIQETCKRALDLSGDLDDHRNKKKQKASCLDVGVISGVHAERLMELEETLSERKIQEEQDRLLAIKLQKLLDKDVKKVIRQKGSPDEYKLRPKTPAQQQEPIGHKHQKSSVPGGNMEHVKTVSSESEDKSDENKKPTPKGRTQRHQVRANRAPPPPLGSLFPDGTKVLRQSNKQQTILDMFGRSSGK